MNIYDALISFDNTLTPKLADFITNIIGYVQAFAAVIMTFYVAVRVAKSFMGGSERIDPTTLVRPCLTLGAIFLYSSLTYYLVTEPINIINDTILYGAAAATSEYEYGDDLSGMISKMTYNQTSGGPDGGGVNDILQINDTLEILHFIIFFFASVAGGYVLFRQLIVKSLYFLIGPFALAVSLIEGNHGVLAKWFQGYFSVLLWLPVLSIVQALILMLPVEETDFVATDIIFSIALQVVLIFTVFNVPKYANILVEQGSQMGSDLGQTFKGKLGGGIMNKLKK